MAGLRSAGRTFFDIQDNRRYFAIVTNLTETDQRFRLSIEIPAAARDRGASMSPVIDTHAHVSPFWYEPVETLLYQMDRHDVDRAALIQYNGQFDNGYQAECVRRHPDRFYSVVGLDTTRPDAPATLAQLADQGAAGVRLRAEVRSPGDDPLAIWAAAGALGLPISIMGTAEQFVAADFVALVAALPNATLILEHLGSVNLPDGEDKPYPVRRKVFDLARFPNVTMKVPGLGEFCRRPLPIRQPFPLERDSLAILDLAVAAFGPDRLMWGSDFPPVCGREGYANALAWVRDAIPAAMHTAIFGGTAARVFGQRGRG